MSNLILNIRFGGWFLQLSRDRPYPGGSRWSLTKPKFRKPLPGEPLVEVYRFPCWR